MPPRIYTLEEHRLPRDRFDRDALWIIHKLRRAGFLAYIVGGGVRDPLMGLTPKDADIATSARPGQVRKHLHNCLLIGRRFRLAHVRFGAKIVEVATFRSGEGEGDLLVRDNCWGTPEEDARRRDFTINGLLYDPFEQVVLDYVGGVEDVRAKVLKTIGAPELRFREDPVRMLRLLKFRARLDLAIDEQTHQAMLDCRSNLRLSSPARIFEELMRMLESGAALPFFSQMLETELLGAIFPSLQKHAVGIAKRHLLDLLAGVDRYIVGGGPTLSRQTLFASLLFPILEAQLQMRDHRPTPMPSAVEVATAVRKLLGEIVAETPLFPRKLLTQITHVLQHQFRMRALAAQPAKATRLLRHGEFPLSLELLALRSLVNPDLRQQLSEWKASWDQLANTFDDEDDEGEEPDLYEGI